MSVAGKCGMDGGAPMGNEWELLRSVILLEAKVRP